jgi:cell division protein FtsW
MARKLKSDKVLFLATLLLVCVSVVMVYSASAMLATQRFTQPYYFLIRQGMWAALGLAAMTLTMRFDYRHYREPSFIWMALGAVTSRAGGGVVRPAHQRQQPLVRAGRHRRAAVGASRSSAQSSSWRPS